MTKFICFMAIFFSFSSLIANDLLLKPPFEVIISKKEIAAKVDEVAKQVDRDLSDQGVKEVVLIAVMKGAICFAADFMRAFKTPFTFESIRASSYGSNGILRGELILTGLDEIDLQGRDVLVLDDIFDSGKTLSAIVEETTARGAKSVRSIVALQKNTSYLTDYRPDYSLFNISDLFVVGYGMDHKEYWRGFPSIVLFKESP